MINPVGTTRRLILLVCVLAGGSWIGSASEAALRVGFASRDITPTISEDQPVWLAGYTPGRKATKIHDSLFVRAFAIADGQRTLAFASVDLVGLQYPLVLKIRNRLPDIDYVVVSSTHNHEGPDVIGLWGPNYLLRGVNSDYLRKVEDRIVACLEEAYANLMPARAHYGVAEDEALVRDNRLPIVKDARLRVLKFTEAKSDKVCGIVCQWNVHPEAMGAGNTEVTADFPFATVASLKKRYECPVAYFSGAVGGLMAPPREMADDAGNRLRDGTFEFTEHYGNEVAKLADRALQNAKPIELTPFLVTRKPVAVPVRNPVYRAARLLGVVKRQSVRWTGDPEKIGPVVNYTAALKATAVVSEVAYVRLGSLHVACIPGELYPELVYGQFQEPAEEHADYPEAELEPTIQQIMPSDQWMLFGLANDELGYFIPRRQWDNQAPYAYGRDKPQYGEINSCSVDAAAIVMAALARRVKEAEIPNKTK